MFKILSFPEFYKILLEGSKKNKLNYDVCRIIYQYYIFPKPKFNVGDYALLNIVHHQRIFKINKILEFCKFKGYLYELECSFGSTAYEQELIKLTKEEKLEYDEFVKSFSEWLLQDDDLIY